MFGKVEYTGVIRIIRKRRNYPYVDVLLNCFKVKNPKGKLKKMTKESKNFWIEYKKALKLKNTYEHYKKDLKNFLSGKIFLEERIIESA